MKITSATYISSKSNYLQCPNDGRAEYAFIGRSNVGKSSLINALTERRKLALTSSTPGKTMCINHFLINEQWYLVDLPGYGYAQRGKKEVEKLKEMISCYVLKREQLVCLFVLIDIRHNPQKVDLAFLHFLGSNGVPFAIVFTGHQTHRGKISQHPQGRMGRTAPTLHHQCHSKDRQGRIAYIHRRNQQKHIKSSQNSIPEHFFRQNICHYK